MIPVGGGSSVVAAGGADRIDSSSEQDTVNTHNIPIAAAIHRFTTPVCTTPRLAWISLKDMRSRVAVVLAALVLGLSGCGPDEPADDSPSASAPDTSACDSVEQVACDFLVTVAEYMERMAGECEGLYVVPSPSDCSASIYYDDVEVYAADRDGIDLPMSAVIITVDADRTDYLAGTATSNEAGVQRYCSLKGSAPKVTCGDL